MVRGLARRAGPAELGKRVAASPRLRVLRLMWETSPALLVTMGLFVVADGVLPILALVALGRAVGHIPAAVTQGLGSAAGHSLLITLAIGTVAYALSLLRSPTQDLISAHTSAVMSTGMQRRLAQAVCAPVGVEHLEDSAVLDQLASASGELSTSGPADAPMALASALGDRLSGFIACVVLATFRWYIGLLFFVGWSLLRPPLRRLLAERALLARRATPELRHSWYYLGCSYRPMFAKEVRVFGLGSWILGRHRDKWLAGMAPSWRQMRHFSNRALLFGLGVAAMYVTGASILALAAWNHDIQLATVATMLTMLPSTMQVGGVSAADVSLEQMLAAVPDLDDLVGRLRTSPAGSGGTSAAGRPRGIRFESVGYRYPSGGAPVYQDLDLELTAGQSLALVGANGSGKTTLVTLLARLREPTAGRITVDGTDLRDLDARAWQRQVAVVNQDFGRYPLSARENIAFRDLTADGLADLDEDALERAAARAGALEFIRALPHGWDTVCAPGYHDGTDLSGGQWQRIALARALYAAARGARVLVLDEPTAQLDIRAEAAFYNRFLELTSGLTTMLISHRFATVRRAERIAVLDQGRITELGSHDELVAAGGSYAEMFAMQAARFAEAAPAQAAAHAQAGPARAAPVRASGAGRREEGSMADRRPRRFLAGGLIRQLRRLDVLFGTAWRADPLLATKCVLAALGSSLFMLAYPLGFRAIVDGAFDHRPGLIVTGLVLTAIAFPASWVLQLVGAALNSRMTDLGNLSLGLRIGKLTCDAPFLEHFERPDYLTEIDTLRERRRNLAGAPAQTLGMLRSGIVFVGAAVLLALVWPPLIVVPLLAIAPAVADRKAARVEKRSDDDLADRRRLLDDLFSLASTAAPARELRTFGATDGVLARHVKLGDEVNRKALRAAHVAALWEASGWVLYAVGFGAAIVSLVIRAAHGQASPGAVVEVVSLLRRAQRQVTGASTSAGSFATAATSADRLLWLEDYVAGLRPGTGQAVPEELAVTTGAFQDYVRFAMSLGDGVGAGDLPRIDDREAVLSAIGRAGAGDLIEDAASGQAGDGLSLDTLLGPYVGGRALSGGQWQRLALARGLMRERPLLIVLDEPTASLDAPSEAALFASYREAARGRAGGAITVLVSHRFGTVHMADQIIVMNDGRVAESGDHRALIAQGGLYAELFGLQAAGYQA